MNLEMNLTVCPSTGTIQYPVLLYGDDFIQIMHRDKEFPSLELGSVRALNDLCWSLIDSQGAVFGVVAWTRGKSPFRNKGIARFLLFALFVEPTLKYTRMTTVEQFAKEIGDMLSKTKMYLGYYDTEEDFRRDLGQASTFAELFQLLDHLP